VQQANKGEPVLNFVLDDPELSKEYAIRAITRDVTSAKAEALKKKGVEVVIADTTDASSFKCCSQRGPQCLLLDRIDSGPKCEAA